MKKYFLLILISFLSYANVFSQTAIDSALNNMNVDSIHDSTKIYKLYRAASSFAYENPDSSNKLLDIGLDYLQNSNQLFKTSDPLNWGTCFFNNISLLKIFQARDFLFVHKIIEQ